MPGFFEENYAASSCSAAGAPFNSSFNHPSSKSFDPWIADEASNGQMTVRVTMEALSPEGDNNIMVGQVSKPMKENIVQ